MKHKSNPEDSSAELSLDSENSAAPQNFRFESFESEARSNRWTITMQTADINLSNVNPSRFLEFKFIPYLVFCFHLTGCQKFSVHRVRAFVQISVSLTGLGSLSFLTDDLA